MFHNDNQLTSTSIHWLDEPFLARGKVTELLAPPGIDKSLVALSTAVQLAWGGFSVLMLDMHSSRAEIQQRLETWGGGRARHLFVMTRDEVPSITDLRNSFDEYDLVIVDSLDELGDEMSAQLVGVAHRRGGPAVLTLNTMSEDRADLCFELREPSCVDPDVPIWNQHLEAGVERWAGRPGCKLFQLDLLSSKFHIDREPESRVLEFNDSANRHNNARPYAIAPTPATAYSADREHQTTPLIS